MVHGAWHGAWCWYKVVPLLQRAGHIVIAPDLPSLGRDRTPLSQVSLDIWAAHICHFVDTASEPVVLVGHSRAGIIISEVAERRPEKIAVLVYLAAYLLRDGESLLPVAQRDGTSLVFPNLIISEDQTSSTIKPQAIREVFYAECSDRGCYVRGDAARSRGIGACSDTNPYYRGALRPSAEGLHRVPSGQGYSGSLAATDVREAALPQGRLLEHRSLAVLFSSTGAHRESDCARCRRRRLTTRPPAS